MALIPLPRYLEKHTYNWPIFYAQTGNSQEFREAFGIIRINGRWWIDKDVANQACMEDWTAVGKRKDSLDGLINVRETGLYQATNGRICHILRSSPRIRVALGARKIVGAQGWFILISKLNEFNLNEWEYSKRDREWIERIMEADATSSRTKEVVLVESNKDHTKRAPYPPGFMGVREFATYLGISYGQLRHQMSNPGFLESVGARKDERGWWMFPSHFRDVTKMVNS